MMDPVFPSRPFAREGAPAEAPGSGDTPPLYVLIFIYHFRPFANLSVAGLANLL